MSETHKVVSTCNSHRFLLPIKKLCSTKFGKRIKTNKPIKWLKHCGRARTPHNARKTAKVWREGYHICYLPTNECSNTTSARYMFLMSFRSYYMGMCLCKQCMAVVTYIVTFCNQYPWICAIGKGVVLKSYSLT